MVPYETVIIIKLPCQRESPAKTPYILNLVAHISKMKPVTPFCIAEK